MGESQLVKYFQFQCEKGFISRGLDKLPPDQLKIYRKRLEYEMEVILRMNFPGYFLVVQDIILWAKKNDIPVGPGRGSIGGCLDAYCMGITNVDPIKYGLFFERFLNEGRKGTFPDIDMDFSRAHRDQVLEYVASKYGQDCIARIGTFGLMRAKNAVRNVARALGHPYEIGDQLSKLLLPPIHGKPQPLKTSIEKVPELKEHYNKNGAYGHILRLAERFEGLVNNVGVHAAGVVISDRPLQENVPLFLGRGKEIAAQWEMNNLEKLGYIKFDFLGLDTLTRMHKCLKLIKERYDKDIDIDTIDLEDDNVYKQLRNGSTQGVFQLEGSTGLRDLVVQVRPTRLEDLSAILAIFRPGPLAAKGLKNYLEVRAGKAEPNYLVPELEPILRDTSGFMIYQEQMLRIAKDLAGYDLKEADMLRKACGKKLPEEMAKHEKKLKEGCSNLPSDKVDILWEQIKAFASYSFNYAHSLEYAMIAYQTAWLKTYYPVEWMCSIMTCDKDNKDQMIKYIAECKKLNINILPPNINKSSSVFTIDEDNNIVFGISPIKGLGEKSVISILKERENGSFKTLTDFCQRIDLSSINKLKIANLVKSGCFDFTKNNRNSLLSGIDRYWEYKSKIKSFENKMVTYIKKKEACKQRLLEVEAGKKLPSGAKVKPLKIPKLPEKPSVPEIPHLREMPEDELLKNEHSLLGFYINDHPLDRYDIYSRGLLEIERIKQLTDSGEITLAAVISSRHEITTKKTKQKMAFITLEDQTGQIDAVVFAKTYKRFFKLIDSGKPLFVYGYLEVTEGEEGNICKIRAGKLADLNSIVPRRKKAKTPITDLPIRTDKIKETTHLLKQSKDGIIEVRPTVTLNSGVQIIFQKIFKVDKEILTKLEELNKQNEIVGNK